MDRDLDRVAAVGGGDAGGDALARFDADGERGAERRLVVLGHRAQAEMVGALLGQAEADQPARVRRHEVDRVGRRELRRDREVALVLAVGIVDDDDHPAFADVLDRLLDRRERRGHGHGRRLAGEQLLDVLGEHVGLEVHTILGFERRRAWSRRACVGSARPRTRRRRPRRRSGSCPAPRSSPSRPRSGAGRAARRTRSASRRPPARRSGRCRRRRRGPGRSGRRAARRRAAPARG